MNTGPGWDPPFFQSMLALAIVLTLYGIGRLLVFLFRRLWRWIKSRRKH